MSDSVTAIGDYVFAGCTSLRDMTIPHFVTSIGKEAFSGCKSLKGIIIPNTVTTIRDSAFANCEPLTLTVGRNSYAAQYAKENAIPYTYSDSQDWLNG